MKAANLEKHVIAVHVSNERRRLYSGELTREDAQILNAFHKERAAWERTNICPLGCDKKGRVAEFTVYDSLKRHMDEKHPQHDIAQETPRLIQREDLSVWAGLRPLKMSRKEYSNFLRELELGPDDLHVKEPNLERSDD
ncbi:hypothetical protein M422DRAFT_783781 [Sphaerobolus stellatus SS14]|uniref:Uncharacterized protein n=1 Tax=Sphaerobolus stellatus (strain SS14) TaxID=990650 RepID=A0A0C9V1F5_SPHS4|nr:hypothetical protein M422DRAFT_783781 [Sphaerobolus stellatus SS14]